jgi:predicted O-methyltransferase YrrM
VSKLDQFATFISELQPPGVFDDFPAASVPEDEQGFQSPENVDFVDRLFALLKPTCLLELGSWKGTSAIAFAKRMRAYCENPLIACVDTWTGSIEHWEHGPWRAEMHLVWGFPTLFDRFAANVVRAGVAAFIRPLPMTTRTALALLKKHRVLVDAVYLDADHSYASVVEDLSVSWDLIDETGFVLVDDVKVPDIARALAEFCERPDVSAFYNSASSWPQAVLLKDPHLAQKILGEIPGVERVTGGSAETPAPTASGGMPGHDGAAAVRLGDGEPRRLKFDFSGAEVLATQVAIERCKAGRIFLRKFAPDGAAEPLDIYTVQDALIIGQPGVFGLMGDGKYTCLAESVCYGDRASEALDAALASVGSEGVDACEIESACLLACHWSGNVWHWFTEYVPKAVALERTGFSGIYLVPSGQIFRDSLELLGVEPSRVVEHCHDYVKVAELAYTQGFDGHQINRYPWLVHDIRERYVSHLAPADGPTRLYIARRQSRRVVNEDALLELIERWGFTRVYMEDHPLATQLGMALAAEAILGPHGAGMVFSMFMRPRSVLVEFFSPQYINPCMLAACEVLGHHYHMIAAQVNPPGEYSFDSDICVNIRALENILRGMPLH